MNVDTAIVPGRMLRLALSVCLAIVLGLPGLAQGQQPAAIGPYVQNVGTSNATICWATVSGEVTVAPPVNKDASFRDYQMHSILLRGLKPGTTYTYSVPGDAGDAGHCSFTTFPKGEHPFSFCVTSDTQNRGNNAHQATVERLMTDQPDMLFITGDLVSDGRNIGDWEEFFRVQGPLLRRVPCYAALGNHDRHSDWYFRFFALPGNEAYYSFDRGAAHFVVLDSPGLYMPEDNQPVTTADRDRFERRSRRYWQEQMQWFKDDLSGHADAKYVFVFLHYPIYCLLASRVESTNELRTRFGTVFQDHRVTAVFSGHDHHYHREVAGGVHFLDGGAAGGKARLIDAPILPETVKHAVVESFARVEVGPQRAKVRVTDVAGNAVDEFELSPRSQPATKAK
jgi:3',5'-cyclic AMP phosphodiesterase CpdA